VTVPRLEPGKIHVWRLQTDGSGKALRTILGAYVGADPGGMRLTTGSRGKPRLDPGSQEEWLRFNLSHTHGQTLLALARDREVGIDVERIAPDRAISTIADELFSVREAAFLRSLPPPERIAGFFRLWTRKEAVLKALGTGLGLGPPLDEIDVRSRTVAAGGVVWTLRDLDVGSAYAAALAVEGTTATCLRWFPTARREHPSRERDERQPGVGIGKVEGTRTGA
jgi:4'-phosphopantetheinyl transferase